MKKLLSLLMCGLLLFGCSDKYDDSSLRNDLNDLENRVAKLEELCKQMNTNISSLQKIVEAMQDNLSISRVEQISDGYIIHFSDGSTATIKNGKDSGNAPIIGVKQDTDGHYYWTLDGDWLTDEKGYKIIAQGTNGTDGEDGITPQLKIENGRWMLSMDNGKTWTDIGQATGADGTDGEDGIDGKDGTNGIFKSVTEDDDNVYFTLEDDSVITIPKSDNSKFAIAFDTTDIAILNGGGSKTISYTIKGATENTVVKAIAQDGWKVKVDATSTDKGIIMITAPNPIVESEILVFANDGSYRTVMVSLNCMQGQIVIADNSIDIASDGGRQEIKLTTNLDYTIEIPEDAKSWLSLAPETRAMREDIIVFNIDVNEGITRFATVALKDREDNILQTIIIRQLGAYTDVHVEKKGQLENTLADYDYANIKSLKITGELNDVDFLFIGTMQGLANLDISEIQLTILPNKCFAENKNIQNIILPKTLTEIGERMFLDCIKLKEIIIPQKVISIGELAFQGTAITNIVIPSSVKSIGRQAFYSLGLNSLTFAPNSNLEKIDKSAFSASLLPDITIPASVEIIEESAFQWCRHLTNVRFETNSKLTTIKRYAFKESAITSIEIPASVEYIDYAAFKQCQSLTTVTFAKNSRLQTIAGKYEGGVNGDIDDDEWQSQGAFTLCSSLLTIQIPASVTEIGLAAFKGCTSLETVTFEKGSQLKKIAGAYYFPWNYDLESYRNNYYGVFANCTALTTITIPASVETIELAAFQGCSSLQSVKFESNSLLSVIGGRKTTVGNGYGKTFYYGAFKGCPIKTFDATGCQNLTTIQVSAFDYNTISLFKLGTVNPPICDCNFAATGNSVLKVPAESVEVYKQAAVWKNFANISALDE